jgi:tetratricopeptide (TPR) repeat protein
MEKGGKRRKEGPRPGRRRRLPAILLACALLAGALAAAALLFSRRPAREPHAGPAAAGALVLTDVTREAGIRFRHEAGARGEMLNPETFGPGAGWLDHDGDGRIDLLLVNGNLLRGAPDPAFVPALYRNLGGGRFADVTREAGLAVPFYGMGFVAADCDNDGDQDVFLYGLHRSVLFENAGGGRFRDVTDASGLAGLDGWVGAAAFLDYDRDGLLDLFVGSYVRWRPELEEGLDCTFGAGPKKYCPVASFDATPPRLFRGRGGGVFEETTAAAGLAGLAGKALGVAVEDYDRDGYPDLFVANDSVPNFLLHNRRDGSFHDRGIESGFATDADGAALAGMGIDTAWLPGGGPLLVGVGNFSGEPTTLHVQEGAEYFVESSFTAGIARATLQKVTFGLLLRDLDLDGEVDLAIANGHVFDVEALTRVPYRQEAQVFLGRGGGRFEEAAPAGAGDFLARPLLGRALAAADYDGDGDLDLVITENQGPAHLLRNDIPGPRRWVRVGLRGTRSARDAIGAEVTLRTSARSRRQTRKSASSYLGQSEPQLTFGCLAGETPLALHVAWPSGRSEVFAGAPLGREVLLVEGTGLEEEGPAAAGVAGAAGAGPGAAGSGAAGAAPPSSLAERRRGLELLAAGRFEEAAEAFERAMAADPWDLVAHRSHLVAVSRTAGARERVEARVREIARAFPSANLLVSHFALVLRAEGHVALAERLFLEASRLDPRRPDIWLDLADLAYDRGERAGALALYQRVLALEPSHTVALANAGKIHALHKDLARARELLEKALELRPGFASALSTLGGVFIEEGELERAEAALLEALRSVAADDVATRLTIHGNLGILHVKRREHGRAAAEFEKVLELDPEDRQAREVLERLRR